ncbi:MAG: S41 family peptidase [Steroidobacteraceae bacterium]
MSDPGRFALRRRLRACIATAVVALLAAGCGGKGIDTAPTSSDPGSIHSNDCSPAQLNAAVLNTAREWYLFPELLPASIDPAAYGSVDDFVDQLTAQARAAGRDRFFSSTTRISVENQLLQGQTVGFGFTLLERGAPAGVDVGQVFADSPAADAGLARGDTLLAIGTSAATLLPIEQVLAAPGGLEEAIGPSTAGMVRALRWRTPAGIERVASLTKRGFTLDAVPQESVRVLTSPAGTPVGHLTFRSFVTDPIANGQAADLAALRAAFAQFRAAGVRDLIVDLRYNGGGLVTIASLLLDLLAGDRAGQVAFESRHNARQSARNETTRLALQPQTVPALRVAFVVTERSASASELVINAMLPYARTAIIGTRTFGKPVGQLAFDVAACDFRLRLVAFRSVNRDGDGDYYEGLPDEAFARAGGAACAAIDDLSHLPGDPLEQMTATALAWIDSPTGQCGTDAIAATAGLRLKPRPPPASPVAAREALRDYLPGTF